MTLTQCIEEITDWLDKTVCPKVVLKCPDDKQVETYKETNPHAFAMFLPGKEKLPPGIECVHPAVVTQIIEGTHTMTEGKTRLKLQLSFTAWNPGTHKEERGETEGGLVRSTDGWKDVWNFLDRTLREIENVEYINGLRVVKELGITFGQFQQEEQVSDLYPYWGAWAVFTVEQGLSRTAESYKNLL